MSTLPWAYRDWSYEAAKEARMYADKLMALASEAENKAEELLAKNAASGLDRDYLIERAAFFQGQASGFRQSAYYLSVVEGTNATD